MVVGIDVAKEAMVAAVMDEEEEIVLKTVRWSYPLETDKFLDFVQELKKNTGDLEVALEPSGVYGDALRWQLHKAGFEVFRVSPKKSHDMSEIYDGVPSSHDGKSAAIVALLHRRGTSEPWPPESDRKRELTAALRLVEVFGKQFRQNRNRLEGLTARHWPELTLTLELGSATALAWARAENVHRADVYVRPARGRSWPLVFVDDVAFGIASRSAQKTSALVVKTSEAGGCHLWVHCSSRLDEPQRLEAQRWLARRLDGDRASVSGEHLGRLAGFKNWKRGGCWINVVEAVHHGRQWNPHAAKTRCKPRPRVERVPPNSERDTSASAREWGWVCGLLEARCAPEDVYQRLLLAARRRGRREPERYARRTCKRARDWVARRRR